MAIKKGFTWRGLTEEEVKKLDLAAFMTLVPSRQRRSLKRGFSHQQQRVLTRIQNGETTIKTHCRDLIILPSMLGKTLQVYNGKEFVAVIPILEMLGDTLGQYVLTRKGVAHNAPGIGATRSSTAISVR